MPLTTDLISYWSLDEASGDAIDAHGTNDLTDQNSVGTGTGIQAGARDCVPGDNSHFTHADNADLRTGDINFEFSCWIKANSLSGYPVIAEKGWVGTPDTSQEWVLFYRTPSDRIRFQVTSGTTLVQVENDAPLSTDTWYFIRCGHDADNDKIYLQINNGTVFETSSSIGVNAASRDFALGASPTQGLKWDGLIDEAGLWKRNLSTSEAAELYNSGSGRDYDYISASSGTSSGSSPATSSSAPPSSTPPSTTYARRILWHGADPTSAGTLIDARAIAGCWFEINRTGGPGPGQLALRDTFPNRDTIELGDWISFEHHTGARWYLGRVEERQADSPAVITLRLEGPAIELNEVYIGGFAGEGTPYRIGATDLYSFDPDRSYETWQTESYIRSVVEWLLDTWVTPATNILHDATLIENDPAPTVIYTYKFRGEESARSLLKTLAQLARGASWGVRADRKAFFLKRRTNLIATFQEGVDLTHLAERRTRDLIYNRLLLTGDYIYPESLNAGRPWRARWNFYEPTSRDTHGERRIRLWVPWIRADADATNFAREFFRTYANPTTRYELTTTAKHTLPLPWTGRARLNNAAGTEITTQYIDRLRVLFDHAPRFEITLGPPDPRTLWPEPPQDERWEIPAPPQAGGARSATSGSSNLTSEPPHSASSQASTSNPPNPSSAQSTGSSGSSTPASSSGTPSSQQSEPYTSQPPSSGADPSSNAPSSGNAASSTPPSSNPPSSSSTPPSSSAGGASSECAGGYAIYEVQNASWVLIEEHCAGGYAEVEPAQQPGNEGDRAYPCCQPF